MTKNQMIDEISLNGSFKHSTRNNETPITPIENELPRPQKKPKSRKQRITVQISEEIIERIKNAVYWTPGLTLASLTEEALYNAVDQLEEDRKAPFPKRKGELKTGRPIN